MSIFDQRGQTVANQVTVPSDKLREMQKEIESLREQIKKADVEYVNRGLHIDMLEKREEGVEGRIEFEGWF